jgi:hypothetical protein
VLKKYAERVPITRPYFEAEPEAPVEAFEAAPARHPVFRIGEALVPVCRAATVSGPCTSWSFALLVSCPVPLGSSGLSHSVSVHQFPSLALLPLLSPRTDS